MPNLKKTKDRLALYKQARGQLKNSKPIMVEGVLLNPSMDKNDSDSDLASVERLITFLEDRVKAAAKQALRSGMEVEMPEGMRLLLMAKGAPSLAAEAGLTEDDIKAIIPTGSGGNISKRDIRVYASHKTAGTLEEYFERTKKRLTAVEVKVEKPKAKKVDKPESNGPKPLNEMDKDELVSECKMLGLPEKGVKKKLIARIKEALKKPAEPVKIETEPETESVKVDTENEPEKTVNPIA